MTTHPATAARARESRDGVPGSSGLVAFTCDQFTLPLPEGHRFPMRKYARLKERVLEDGILAAAQIRVPEPIDDASILRVHTRDYLEALVDGTLDKAAVRLMGFPWSPALMERSRRSASATYLAARAALDSSAGAPVGSAPCLHAAVNLAGGTHHAFPGHGEGFCVLNDVAIAVRRLQAEGHIERALVVDCDVHQGNGTAVIFERDASVFTLSLHGRRNYPFRKKTSSLDVELEDGTGDEAYLAALQPALAEALRAADADVAIYLAGADPFEGDRLGRLALTKQGLAARDAAVFGALAAAGLPVAVAMAGGYAEDVEDIVDIHVETVRQAARLCVGLHSPSAYGRATGSRGE